MTKGLRIFLLLFSVVLITACGSLWIRYTDQKNYQEALENSNFLQWCGTISAENLEIATISCGYGANTNKHFLSLEEKEAVCKILHEFSSDALALTEDGKEYFILTGQDADINFYMRDNRGEFEFRYRPTNPKELYIRSNSEMGDSYKNRQNRWTTNETLIDFILTHAPKES